MIFAAPVREGTPCQVTAVAEASSGVKVEQAGKAAVRYRGQTPLAIGVELVEDVERRFPYRPRPIRMRPHVDGSVVDQ